MKIEKVSEDIQSVINYYYNDFVSKRFPSKIVWEQYYNMVSINRELLLRSSKNMKWRTNYVAPLTYTFVNQLHNKTIGTNIKVGTTMAGEKRTRNSQRMRDTTSSINTWIFTSASVKEDLFNKAWKEAIKHWSAYVRFWVHDGKSTLQKVLEATLIADTVNTDTKKVEYPKMTSESFWAYCDSIHRSNMFFENKKWFYKSRFHLCIESVPLSKAVELYQEWTWKMIDKSGLVTLLKSWEWKWIDYDYSQLEFCSSLLQDISKKIYENSDNKPIDFWPFSIKSYCSTNNMISSSEDINDHNDPIVNFMSYRSKTKLIIWVNGTYIYDWINPIYDKWMLAWEDIFSPYFELSYWDKWLTEILIPQQEQYDMSYNTYCDQIKLSAPMLFVNDWVEIEWVNDWYFDIDMLKIHKVTWNLDAIQMRQLVKPQPEVFAMIDYSWNNWANQSAVNRYTGSGSGPAERVKAWIENLERTTLEWIKQLIMSIDNVLTKASKYILANRIPSLPERFYITIANSKKDFVKKNIITSDIGNDMIVYYDSELINDWEFERMFTILPQWLQLLQTFWVDKINTDKLLSAIGKFWWIDWLVLEDESEYVDFHAEKIKKELELWKEKKRLQDKAWFNPPETNPSNQPWWSVNNYPEWWYVKDYGEE